MTHPKIATDDEGNLWLNFGRYGGAIDLAAISGDGRRVLMVREVGMARIWAVETGELLAEIEPDSPLRDHPDAAPTTEPFCVFIESASLDHEGSLALLGLNDGTAVVYEVDSARRLAVLHPPDEQPAAQWSVVRAVRHSPDGKLALVGFSGRSVGVWSADGSRLLAFLRAASGRRLFGEPFVRDTMVSSVAASADGRAVFIGAADGSAALFDSASNAILFEATEHAEDMLAVFDGPQGIGWATTAGKIWVSRDGGPPTTLLDTGEAWAEVVFEHDRVLARGRTGEITRWTFAGEREQLFAPHEPRYGRWASNAATLGLAGTRVHYPEHERRLIVRDGDRCSAILRDQPLVRAAFSPTGARLATDGWKDQVELWDPATGELVHILPCPGGSGCFGFSPDGSLLATGAIGHGGGLYPRRVHVYEVETGTLRWTLDTHRWQVRRVAFSPDGRLLASLADELVLWELDALACGDDEPLLRIQLARGTGDFTFAGTKLVAVEEGRVRVLEDGHERLTFAAPIAWGTRWQPSHDGRHLVVGHGHALLRFDLETGQLERSVVAAIPLPERFPSPELAGQHEIRAAANLWRTQHGRFLHQGDGPRGWIEPLEISADDAIVVPCERGAAVLQITDDGARLRGIVPFEGKLRASRVVGNDVLLVNHEGRLFRGSCRD